MCLLLLAFRAHPDVEVLLGGNRDEFRHRPAAPPQRIAGQPCIYAGRDLEAGGTWLGRNEGGLLAALTNKHGNGAAPAARSRGRLVLELLGQRDVAAALRWLAAEDMGRYRPFNLLFGDSQRFFYLDSQAATGLRELSPGYYALSNSTLNDLSWPKVARALRLLEEQHHQPGEALLKALCHFLGDTAPGAGAGGHEMVFIPSAEYGTVSSSILAAGGVLGERYYFADFSAPPSSAAETTPLRSAGWGGVRPPDDHAAAFRRVRLD